jgi:hypothetical protein
MNKKAEQLADLIEKNPNCFFNIDNDVWYMMDRAASMDDTEDNEPKEITESGEYDWSTDWYSHSSNYGAGIAEALIVLLNRRGFNIKAEAV